MNSGYVMLDLTGWVVGKQSAVPGIYKRFMDAIATNKVIIGYGFKDGENHDVKPTPLVIINHEGNLSFTPYVNSSDYYAVDSDDVISN